MPFTYTRPASPGDAARELAAPGAHALGGGTDLVVSLHEGIMQVDAVVDLRRLPGAREIAAQPGGGVRIGAGALLADIAAHALVAAGYPALAQACTSVGTPQLRNMGTLGGNLCQRPRCWYFRRGVSCHKSGGTSCPAVDGASQYLGILGGGPCHAPHAGDPAVALLALDASVVVAGPAGERRLDIDAFFDTTDVTRETVLASGEFVAAVELPAASAGGVQRYDKLMQRGAWDFALVSLAAARRANGDVRLVLGGVAPRPWRVTSSIEEDVASGGLDDDTVATLAERALYDARPLAGNGYKVRLAAALLRRAIAAIAR